ncbi:hypothetical protein [Winogradskyella sp.]|uniref:hypothetical protein n=1 Tax=Winogradskyella sp. TaxID=1883156 RepID=UPI0035C7B04C
MKTSSLTIVLFFLFTVCSFAQDDNDLKELQDFRKEKIKSQKKEIKDLNDKLTLKEDEHDSIIKIKQTQIKNLRSDLQKKIIENRGKVQEAKTRATDQFLDKISRTYLSNNNFDDLINSSNIQTLQRDMDLLSNKLLTNKMLKQKFDDLKVYFTSIALLDIPFNEIKVKTARQKLSLIKQQSKLIPELNENLEYYQDTYQGFTDCIDAIKSIDLKGMVNGKGRPIEMIKYNNIVAKISSYIKSFGLTYSNYPYISEILFKIIDKKYRNVDANIQTLLNSQR